MGCILMAMSVRMLWHTGLALLPDERSMRNNFTSGTMMVLSTEHVMTLESKWRVDDIGSFLSLMMSQFSIKITPTRPTGCQH